MTNTKTNIKLYRNLIILGTFIIVGILILHLIGMYILFGKSYDPNLIYNPLNSNYFLYNGKRNIEPLRQPLSKIYQEDVEVDSSANRCYSVPQNGGIDNDNELVFGHYYNASKKVLSILKGDTSPKGETWESYSLHNDVTNGITDCNENAYFMYNNVPHIFNQGKIYNANTGVYHTLNNFTPIMEKSIKKFLHVGNKLYIFANGMTEIENYKYFTKGFINIIEVDLFAKTETITDITDFTIPLNFQFVNSKNSLKDITPQAAGVSGDAGFKGMTKEEVERFFSVIEKDNNANNLRVSYDLNIFNNKLSFMVGKFEFNLSTKTPSIIKHGSREIYSSWLSNGSREYIYLPTVKTTKADIMATLSERSYLLRESSSDDTFKDSKGWQNGKHFKVKNELNYFMNNAEITDYNNGNENALFNAYINDGRIYYDLELYAPNRNYNIVGATGDIDIFKRHSPSTNRVINIDFNQLHYVRTNGDDRFSLTNYDVIEDTDIYDKNDKYILNYLQDDGFVDINNSFISSGDSAYINTNSEINLKYAELINTIAIARLHNGTRKSNDFITKITNSLRADNNLNTNFLENLNILTNNIKHYSGLKGLVANCAQNKFDLGNELNALLIEDESLCPSREKMNTYVNNTNRSIYSYYDSWDKKFIIGNQFFGFRYYGAYSPSSDNSHSRYYKPA